MSLQKVTITQYNLRRVFESLLKVYKPMARGEENNYNDLFHCFDSNMLKIVRTDSNANSRRAREAVDLCLISINGYLHNLDYDMSALTNPGNLALMRAMQMAYDPFVNPSLAKVDLNANTRDLKVMTRQFEYPFRCLYRLRDSIDFWINAEGSNGYFLMVDREIGNTVPRDLKMDYFFNIL